MNINLKLLEYHLENHFISMLSGNIFKTIKFEIFHFVQDDNQLVIYLGGVGWR